MVLALITCPFCRPPLWVALLLMLPMIADGLIQYFTAYESNNLRRVLTGILFGYALVMFLVITLIMAFQYGMRLGENWKLN